MADKSPLNAPLDEDSGDGVPAPQNVIQQAAEAHTDAAVTRRYVLTQGTRQFSVLQYDTDIEVTQTIDYFLNFCRDMGWAIEILGTQKAQC